MISNWVLATRRELQHDCKRHTRELLSRLCVLLIEDALKRRSLSKGRRKRWARRRRAKWCAEHLR